MMRCQLTSVLLLLAAAPTVLVGSEVIHAHAETHYEELLPEASSWRQSAFRHQRRIAPRRQKNPSGVHVLPVAAGRMGMDNVTCHFLSQPLDHFSAPSGGRRKNDNGNDNSGETFEGRYCIYDGYVEDSDTGPIFFYTGNESPVEQYVNETGLMWELAPKHAALVVFAEHRYQGESVPDLQRWNDPERLKYDGCFTHLTSSQALADYAALISYIDPTHKRAVILFGGSYGGMLSAWMRMLYPSSVAGAIAASAPIYGLPLTQEGRDGKAVFQSAGISGAAEVIAKAVRLPYPPTDTGEDEHTIPSAHSYCFDNLLATWPLISYYGRTEIGRDILKDIFRLCSPVKDEHDISALLNWAQSPFFDMAEGDFPYPSAYIPFSLNMGNVKLPAWPLQFACHVSGLDSDLGIDINRGDDEVQFTIGYGGASDDKLILSVDWDAIMVQKNGMGPTSPAALNLLNATMTAISVWFNVSKLEKCFDAIPAINEQKMLPLDSSVIANQALRRKLSVVADSPPEPRTVADKCQDLLDSDTVWTSLVCNEEMNQITTAARGMGRDFYWPPTYPRGIKSFKSTLAIDPDPLGEICADPDGIFGFPSRDKYDSWATWLDDYYGGVRISSHSNIVLSNGLLDPWSSAGVYKPGNYYARSHITRTSRSGIEVQNITTDGSIIALTMDLGGHHLDLMFSSDDDPPCAALARDIEDEHITRWIAEWKEQTRATCV